MPASSLRPGLVSITFRGLAAEEVLREAVAAGLEGIEWGGDVHAPHGDLAAAERIGHATRDAGLALPTYGSYLRAGAGGPGQPPVAAVIASAAALGAADVRVWAGGTGSAEAEPADRAAVAAGLREACDRAADAGLGVALEYHAGTLTDTADSCLALLDAVDRPNLSTLWQTTNGASDAHSLATLRRLQPRVRHAHVFEWDTGAADQRPLAAGADRWRRFLGELAAPGVERFCLMEFVRGGTLGQFHADAATLKGWLAGTHPPA
ncbi:sugar phosphate isomerase/epimerase family protein [Phycisphaera mikurensis]|uniref:Xylose isomerase-like TIM barrel domain-containing protein n=1 Tax=Phycisphaera mikurensis (strain NBRC 102666 / KCTC 22515 / FYK2301M01) TaxID=1142394 RepID=I0IAC0_PHYMF|nr:TIM barrel protein [Phycisphaera mikurensis]MBB6441793.1 sugar phosphate isomerase/epimerase [Phycisphaera mikurensis]BAM02208.1 hypothetical protein PSMK_00490 [Phycisphaera mikurensis NBRC 102666]